MAQPPPLGIHLLASASAVARVAEEIEKAAQAMSLIYQVEEAQAMRLIGQIARAFDVPEWMLTDAPRPPSWRGLIKKHRRTR